MSENAHEMKAARRFFAGLGIHFIPIPRHDTTARRTKPTVDAITRLIIKESIPRCVGKLVVTFSGYENDPREVEEIPECVLFWRTLDHEIPELPLLIGNIPGVYDGPSIYVGFLSRDVRVIERRQTTVRLAVAEGKTLAEGLVGRITKAAVMNRIGPEVSDPVVAWYRRLT